MSPHISVLAARLGVMLCPFSNECPHPAPAPSLVAQGWEDDILIVEMEIRWTLSHLLRPASLCLLMSSPSLQS